MSNDLITEIAAARESVIRLEEETSEAGHRLSLSREKLRKARGELDTLLQELVTGQSRYPLPGFDRLDRGAAPPGFNCLDRGDAAANGLASTQAAEASTAPLRGRGKKGATP